MQSSSAIKPRRARGRSHLFDAITLALMLGAVVAGLLAVFPQSNMLKELRAGGPVDRVTLAWLRLRARSGGQDRHAEVLLVEHAIALGHQDEAWEALLPLVELEGPVGVTARRRALDLGMRRWRAAAVGSTARRTFGEEVRAGLRRVVAEVDSESDLETLANHALELGQPLVAAELHVRLAGRPGGVNRRAAELAEAGRLFLAAGDGHRAAIAYSDGESDAGDERTGARLSLRALSALRSADDTAGALALARQLVPRHSRNAALLDAAVAIGLAAQAFDDARAWGAARLALAPNSPEAVARQFDLELQTNHVEEAFQLAKRRVRLERYRVDSRRRLVQVAEWAGHMPVALEEEQWLAHHGQAGALSHALSLARQLADPYAIDDLLHLVLDRGPPTTDALADAVDADESIGESARAVDTARRFVKKVPGEKPAWELLATLLDRTGDREGALATRDEMVSRFGELTADVMAAADLLWRQRRPREALARLRQFVGRVGADQLPFFRMMGELAWAQESGSDALMALERRRQAGDLDAAATEQLVHLLDAAGRRDAAAELAREGYLRFQSPHLLLEAMGEREQQGAFAPLASLLKLADPREFALEPQYWTYRAEVADHEGRLREASLAWQRALVLDPHAMGAQVGCLGLAVEEGDVHKIEKMLAAWRSDALGDAQLAAMFGLAYDKLGRAAESLAWLDRGAAARPHDLPLLLAYAESLGKNGRAAAAQRVRRYLMEKVHASAVTFASAATLDDDGRDVVRTYVTLLGDVKGRAAVQEFFKPLLARGNDDADTRSLLVEWAVREDDIEYARRWLLRGERLRDPLPSSQQAEIALADNDTTKLAEVLAQSPGSLSHEERAEIAEQLGRDDEALEHTRLGLADPTTPLDERMALHERAEELRERAGSGVDVSSRIENSGPLLFDRYDVRGILGAIPHVQLDAGASITDMHGSPEVLRLEGRNIEVVPVIGATIYERFGQTRLEAGARWRGDGTLPYARVLQVLQFGRARRRGRGTEVDFEAVLSELPDESAEMRVAAVRHRIGASVKADFSMRQYLDVTFDLQQFRARDWAYIGQGLRVDVEAGHRILLGRPYLRVFGRGSFSANQLADRLPQSAARILPGYEGPGALIIEPLYGSVGAGLFIGNGDTEDSLFGRRLTYGAEAWAGWIGPANRFAWEVRAGFGLRLLGGTLRLNAFYESDHAALVVQESDFGASLAYDIRFGGI